MSPGDLGMLRLVGKFQGKLLVGNIQCVCMWALDGWTSIVKAKQKKKKRGLIFFSQHLLKK